MKKILIGGGLVFLLAFVAPIGALQAQELLEPVDGAVLGLKVQPIPAKAVQGPYFKFAENLVISENLEGDVYAAGSTVRIDGDVVGDLLVAGGTVVINGNISDDLRVAGGNVTVNGMVGKNVTVGGGNVTFGPSSQVKGSLVGGAGTLDLSGQIAGNVWVGGGETSVQGKVDQDLNLSAESAAFGPESVVGGNLTARVTEGRLLSDQASVGGRKDISFTKVEDKSGRSNKEKFNKAGQVLTMAMVVKWLIGLLVGVVSGGALLYFFRQTADKLAVQVRSVAAGSLGWGLVALVTVPFLALLLMVTIVGLPLGFITIIGYIVALIVAKWVAGYALGQWLEAKTKVEALKNPYLQLAAGLLLIKLVALVPVAGWLVAFGAMLMGLGALFVTFKAQLHRTPAKK